MTTRSQPNPGTREFYMQRKPPDTPEKRQKILRKRKLVERLEDRIYGEVADLLPAGTFTEREKENTGVLIQNPVFINAWFKNKDQLSKVSSQIQNVLGARTYPEYGKARMGQLYGTSESDPVYKFLVELRGAIWDNPGLLDNIENGYDESTREMGKEWAADFLENWISSFENRVHLDTEHYNDRNRDEERLEWSMERKYDLLGKTNKLSPEKRTHFIQQFCLKVPPFSGVELDWDDINDMYEEARDSAARAAV